MPRFVQVCLKLFFRASNIGAVLFFKTRDRSPPSAKTTSLLTAVSVNSLVSQLVPFAFAVHSDDFITVYRYANQAGDFQSRRGSTD